MTPREYVPLPYQPEMEQHLIDHPKALLLVEMGLGKTVVVLKRIADSILNGESEGALIISPLRVSRLTWPEQAAFWKHSAWMRVVNMNDPEGVAAWEAGSAHVYLTHYDVLNTREVHSKCKACGAKGCDQCKDGEVVKKYPGFVAKFLKGRKTIPVDTVVYDEISVFKDHNGKRAAAMRAYHEKFFPVRIGMSGSPLGNSRLNLFNQVRTIDDGERLGASFHAFRNRYAESDYMGYKWTMREGAADEIDRKISDISLVLLCEDHADLPPCYTEDIEVTLPAAAETAYKKMEKELLLELEKGDIVALNSAVLANKCLQILSGECYGEKRDVHTIHSAKIAALAKLRKKLGPTEPVLVLVAFKHEKERILKEIPGSVLFDLKHIDAWRAGKIPTLLADARSLSHGLDGLQVACCTEVWYTPHWSAETVRQTVKRIHRRGVKGPVTIYRLIAKVKDRVSMDEIVIEANRLHADEQAGMFASLKSLQRLHEKKP